MNKRPRPKITIRFPAPEPEPPPKTCALCGKEHPHWRFTTQRPPICWDCTSTDGRRRRRFGGEDYRDGLMIDAAMAVIWELEVEHGPR